MNTLQIEIAYDYRTRISADLLVMVAAYYREHFNEWDEEVARLEREAAIVNNPSPPSQATREGAKRNLAHHKERYVAALDELRRRNDAPGLWQVDHTGC